MIWTSSHNDWQSDKYITYAISGNRGASANYHGNCYPKLAPKLSFWKQWHDNIGLVSEEENHKFYVQEYWNQVLVKLDPEEVYRELDNSILLCYEPNTEFCHRHIVAAWFELFLEVQVPEKKARGYQVEEIPKPSYIKGYLEEVLKNNLNICGFTSLRALYLAAKSEGIGMLDLNKNSCLMENEINCSNRLVKVKNHIVR